MTFIAVRLTPPVLTTRNEYGTSWSTVVIVVVLEDFTMERWAAGAVVGIVNAEGLELTGVAPGGVPCAAATPATEPLSRSAWVAVQVVDAPGASVVCGQLIGPRLAFNDGAVCTSVTFTAVSVSWPVLTTKDEYGTCWPTVLIVGVVDVLTMEISATRRAAGIVRESGGEFTGGQPGAAAADGLSCIPTSTPTVAAVTVAQRLLTTKSFSMPPSHRPLPPRVVIETSPLARKARPRR